ncbi:unnamed protein product [Brassica oleracea var. botrytis]
MTTSFSAGGFNRSGPSRCRPRSYHCTIQYWRLSRGSN